jgi:hypothetical protein
MCGLVISPQFGHLLPVVTASLIAALLCPLRSVECRLFGSCAIRVLYQKMYINRKVRQKSDNEFATILREEERKLFKKIEADDGKNGSFRKT